MDDTGYVLAIGIYDESDDALTDLRDLTNPGPVSEAIAGAAVLAHGLRGSALMQGGGGSTAYGIGTGAAAGVVAGVVLAVPLVGAAAGAVIGGLVGHHLKSRETEGLLSLLGDDLPVGSVALVTVVPESRAAEVRRGMTRALRTTGRLLEDAASRKLGRGLVRGDPTATEALGGSDA